MTAARTAGALYVLFSLGFGGGTSWALVHHAQHGELPLTPWGFRALASDFADRGSPGLEIGGGALIAVCAVQGAAGIALWRRRRVGAAAALLLEPLALGLALLFALPFLLLVIPIRVTLLAVGRHELR